MACLEKLQKYLSEHGVAYSHSTHPLAYTARETAAAGHLPPREVVKTVVVHGDNDYHMILAPAHVAIDLSEVRSTLGLTHARLATEQELDQLFPDCELGAMPPFGNLYGMRVYVDRTLAHDERISFNAGTHRDLVRMRFDDFKRLVDPVIVNVAREAATHFGGW